MCPLPALGYARDQQRDLLVARPGTQPTLVNNSAPRCSDDLWTPHPGGRSCIEPPIARLPIRRCTVRSPSVPTPPGQARSWKAHAMKPCWPLMPLLVVTLVNDRHRTCHKGATLPPLPSVMSTGSAVRRKGCRGPACSSPAPPSAPVQPRPAPSSSAVPTSLGGAAYRHGLSTTSRTPCSPDVPHPVFSIVSARRSVRPPALVALHLKALLLPGE